MHACMHAYIHTYMHACIHTYMHTYLHTYIHTYSNTHVELAWHRGSVMDCHARARGSIPAWNGIFTELHVLRKGQ